MELLMTRSQTTIGFLAMTCLLGFAPAPAPSQGAGTSGAALALPSSNPTVNLDGLFFETASGRTMIASPSLRRYKPNRNS